MNSVESYQGNFATTKSVGNLFAQWEDSWGLRGDPYLWEELSAFLSKEPLPASVSQLMALIEKAFSQLVGVSLSEGPSTAYVARYDHGGLSGGYVSCEFWRTKVLAELHRRYLSIKYTETAKSPRMIDKACRYEQYPGGCRFGATCRFHHSKPVVHFAPFRPSLGNHGRQTGQPINDLSLAKSPRSVFDLSVHHPSALQSSAPSTSPPSFYSPLNQQSAWPSSSSSISSSSSMGTSPPAVPFLLGRTDASLSSMSFGDYSVPF